MEDYLLLNDSLLVGALLFVLGVIGFVSRRNLVVMVLSLGVIFQGGILTLSSFGAFHGSAVGSWFGLFALALTIIPGTVAVALIVVFQRRERSLDVSVWQHLRAPGSPTDAEPIECAAEEIKPGEVPHE